jgi:pimeloyl-ACP methyl ester carboxylesterase
LALDRPQRVRSITVVGTPAVAFGARPDLDLSLLAMPLLGRIILSAPTPFGMYRAILSRSLGADAVRAAPSELLRATHQASRRRGYAATVSSFLREQFEGLKRRPPEYVLAPAELRQLRQPVLVLWGQSDHRYQSLDSARSAAALIPHHLFKVIHAGHEPCCPGSMP